VPDAPIRITTVLFDDFELLDVCGPLEVFGVVPGMFELVLVGPAAGPVASAQGPALAAHRRRSAGIDMALALVAHLAEPRWAERIATGIEHEWHRDPSWDPFAAVHGLVERSVASRPCDGAGSAD
jgi:hypothetical protein